MKKYFKSILPFLCFSQFFYASCSGMQDGEVGAEDTTKAKVRVRPTISYKSKVMEETDALGTMKKITKKECGCDLGTEGGAKMTRGSEKLSEKISGKFRREVQRL